MTNNPKVLVGEEIRNFCGSCKKFHSEPLVTGCARDVLFTCDAGHDRVSWFSPQAEECADYEKRTEAKRNETIRPERNFNKTQTMD